MQRNLYRKLYAYQQYIKYLFIFNDHENKTITTILLEQYLHLKSLFFSFLIIEFKSLFLF